MWIILFLAGVFEAVWAIGLKYSEGFTRFWPSVVTIISMGLSFFLLTYSLKAIPIGTAYAVWAGIGAVGVTVLGIVLFNESTDLIRFLCISLIIIGVIGLQIHYDK